MNRLEICGLCAFVVGCSSGTSHSRIAGREVELPYADASPREGETVRRVGVLWSLTGDTTTLVHVQPATRVNEATRVGAEVSGSGCLGPDTTTVSVEGLIATVVPYQRVFTPRPPYGACAAFLAFDSRDVEVTFRARGTARVRIVYRQGESGALTMTERTVAVQ